MDGIGNNSFATSGSVPSAPPPPPEVKVRTMRSDLEAMAKSGGGLPRFENVKVPGLSAEKQRGAQNIQAFMPKKNIGFLAAIVFASLVVLGAIGYFAYTMFFAGKTAVQPAPAPIRPSANLATTTSNQVSVAQTQATTTPAGPLVHASLFTRPADQMLTLLLSSGNAASSAEDLQTFNQKIITLLAAAKRRATLVEINAKNGDGGDLTISDILTQANEMVIDASVLSAHFNPDATFFVYRDTNGSWPGYVLSLKQGDSWLFGSGDAARLEYSPNIVNFFL
jgi:hypothetical protein